MLTSEVDNFDVLVAHAGNQDTRLPVPAQRVSGLRQAYQIGDGLLFGNAAFRVPD